MAVANGTYFYLDFMGANTHFCFNSTSLRANSKRWGPRRLFFSNLHSSEARSDQNKYYQKTWMHQWVRSWTTLILFPIALPQPLSLGSCHRSVLQQWICYYAEALFLLTISHNIFQAKRLNQLEMNTGHWAWEQLPWDNVLVLPHSCVSTVWSHFTLLTLTDCSGRCGKLVTEPIWTRLINGYGFLKFSQFQCRRGSGRTMLFLEGGGT